MSKQTVSISGAFTLDEFRDIFSSLVYEGFSVTAARKDNQWMVSGSKEHTEPTTTIIPPIFMPQMEKEKEQ